MARGTTQAERDGATLVAISTEGIPLDDVEASFDDWRASFDHAETPGTIRAYQVALDERGMVNMSAKTQIRLGAWAIDLYNFDQLCSMIIADYMLPNNEKIMAVRFLGTKAGQQGVQFNKIVILRAPAAKPNGGAAPPESTATMLKAFQEANERTLMMLQRLQPPADKPDPMAEMMKMATFMQQLNAPVMSLLTSLIPAIAGGRAAQPTGDPFSSLSSAIDVMDKLNGLRGEGGESDDGGDSLMGTIKAVAMAAKPLLESLPALTAAQARQPQRPVIEHGPPAAPGQIPSKTAAPQGPAASATDIPTGDQEMFAQLKPQIDSLVEMAKQGSDPAAAADLLFDQVIIELPDALYGRVADLIGQTNFLRNAAVFNPAVGTYETFFKAFQAQIIKRIEQEDSAAGQEPSA